MNSNTHRFYRANVIGWCIGALVLNIVAPALAGPQGANVVHGNVDIDAQGDVTNITASNGAIINYQSFNIAGHETVRFIQPNAQSRVLNRVMDGNVTRIDGQLTANGRVYIVNPAGVYFGGQTIVNVGAITAAAGNITDADFINGVDRFTDVNGAVVNEGSINGQFVALIGKHVANHGSIVAPDGLVTMAAGETVYLSGNDNHIMVELEGGATDEPSKPAVENTGSIDAPRGRIAMGASDVYTLAARQAGHVNADNVTVTGKGGQVELAGSTNAAESVEVDARSIYQPGTVDVSNADGQAGSIAMYSDYDYLATGSSVLDASGAIGGDVLVRSGSRLMTSGTIDATGTSGDGGSITLVGQGVTSLLSATLDVSATRQGGAIHFGRDADRSVVARRAVVSDGATLIADGDSAGRINLWADEGLYFYGSALARGGQSGFIDVSGLGTLSISQQATLNTNGGTLLIDPKNVDFTTDAPLGLDVVKLQSGDGFTLNADDNFGRGVALSGDGTLLFVGAPFDDTGVTNAGALYVFSFDPGTFATPVFEQKVAHTAIDPGFGGRADFGTGVAVNDAADILLVGAQQAFRSYLFSFDPNNPGTAPVLQQTLTGAGGTAVALNAVGDVAATSNRGSFVQVHKLDTADLTQAPSVMSQENSALDEFGIGVAINGAGDLLAVGTTDDDGGTNLGTVEIFTLDPADVGAGLTHQQSVGNGDGGLALSNGDTFGTDVTMSNDGELLYVGANQKVYALAFDPLNPATAPVPLAVIDDNEPNITFPNNNFFQRVATNADGSLLAVGAYWDNGAGVSTAGAVYMIDTITSGLSGLGFGETPTASIEIHPQQLVDLLDGNNVIVQANNDIAVSSSIDATGNAGLGDLTLMAGRSIDIIASIALRGSFTGIANANFTEGVVDAQRDAGAAAFTMATGIGINTSDANGNIEIHIDGGYGLTNADSGDIQITFLDAGQGNIDISHDGRTDGGSITVMLGLDAANFGWIDIGIYGDGNTTGDVNIDGSVDAQNSQVSIMAPDQVNFGSSGQINIQNSRVEIEADSVVMSDGSSINTDGGTVDILAVNDITVGQINVFGPNLDGIHLISTQGSIIDGGDTGGADINAYDGSTTYAVGSHLYANNGIGIAGGNGALEVRTPYVTTYTNDTDQSLFLPGGAMAFEFIADGGAAGGAGDVTIDTPLGLTDTDGMYDVIANNVDFSVGGSITDGGIFGNHALANSSAIDMKIAGTQTFNVSGGNDTVVNAAPIDVTISDGNTGNLVSTTGTITIDTTSVGINNGGLPVIYQASGAININQNMQVGSSSLAIQTHDQLTVTGTIGAAGGASFHSRGDMTLDGFRTAATFGERFELRAFDPFAATAPSLAMLNQYEIDVDGGTLQAIVSGDITVGSIVSTSGFDWAIELISREGGIAAGDVHGADSFNLETVNGGAEIDAQTGVGTSANALSLNVSQIEITNHASGEIHLTNFQATAMRIDDLVNHAPGGDIMLQTTGNLTVGSDTISANGGDITVLSDGDIALGGFIAFAGTVTLRSGWLDGTGDIFWTATKKGIVADAIHLRAGDGQFNAGSTATVDARTNNPFFTNQAITDAPDTFAMHQDASIDNTIGLTPLQPQFGPDASLDGITLSYQSDNGNVNLTDDGTSNVALIANAPNGSVTFNGTFNGIAVNAFAGNDINVNVNTTTSSIGFSGFAVDLTAGNAINMTDGTVTDLGNGNLTATAGAGGIHLSQITTTSNTSNAITLDATSTGSILNNDTSGNPNLSAPNGGIMVTAGGDIGASGTPILVDVLTPNINDFTATNVFVDFGTGDLFITAPVNVAGDNMTQNFTTLGNLFVNAIINTSGNNSPITITAGGDVQVNQTVTTTGNNSLIAITSGMDLTVDADVGTTGTNSPVALTADGNVTINSGATVSNNSGGIFVTTDANDDNVGGIFTIDGTLDSPSINLFTREITHSESMIDAGAAGRVTITGQDDQEIHLGATHDAGAAPLEIEQSIFDIITAAVLDIIATDSASGIYVADDVNVTTVNTLRLSSAGEIANFANEQLQVSQLAVVAVTDIDLDGAVGQLAGLASNGYFDFENTGDMAVGTVDGVTGIQVINGDLDLSVFSTLTGSGSITVPNGALDIFADGDINHTGFMLVNGTATFGTEGGNITVGNNASVFNGLVDFQGGEDNPMNVNFSAANTVTFDGFFADGDVNLTLPTMNMTTQINSTGGDATFNGDLVLFGSDWTVVGNDVSFNGRVNSDGQSTPRSLIVNTFGNGMTRFYGSVGAGVNDIVESNDILGVGGDDMPLSHLQTNADGITQFFGPKIVLNGSSAQFDNPAQINNDMEIVELGGGDVTFDNTLDGAAGNPSLTINQVDTGGGAGNVNFNNNVGGNTPLGGMTVNTPAGSQTNVAGDVTTTGTQDWNTQVNATQDVQLTGGDVNLNQGTAPGSNTVNVSEVALGENATNLAEVLPRSDGEADAQGTTGPESELSSFLSDFDITAPASLRDAQAPRRVQNALDDYLLTLDLGADFNADGFLNFLGRNAQHRRALRVLFDTRDTLDVVAEADLPDADKTRIRQRIIDTIKPAGMTRGEFDAVINALPRGADAVAMAS